MKRLQWNGPKVSVHLVRCFDDILRCVCVVCVHLFNLSNKSVKSHGVDSHQSPIVFRNHFLLIFVLNRMPCDRPFLFFFSFCFIHLHSFSLSFKYSSDNELDSEGKRAHFLKLYTKRIYSLHSSSTQCEVYEKKNKEIRLFIYQFCLCILYTSRLHTAHDKLHLGLYIRTHDCI